jgi:hypothetical protein
LHFKQKKLKKGNLERTKFAEILMGFDLKNAI